MKKQTYDFNIDTYLDEHLTKEERDELFYKGYEYWSIKIESCESPIEKILFAYMLFVFETDQIIAPQVEVSLPSKIRRLDFVVGIEPPSPSDFYPRPLFAIETDGKLHNEEKQVMDDKMRDRDILIYLGLPVIRFTGKEILNDPMECACNVAQTYNSIKLSLISNIFSNNAEDNILSREYNDRIKLLKLTKDNLPF